MYFNDLDKYKIHHLKSVIDEMDLHFVKIRYYNADANEFIINHMVSDVIRGAKNANNPEKIAKYEKIYHKSIDEIKKTSNCPNSRGEFERITNSMIKYIERT